eukprot:15440946-Alexandrium_andersonii.AAC.1
MPSTTQPLFCFKVFPQINFPAAQEHQSCAGAQQHHYAVRRHPLRSEEPQLEASSCCGKCQARAAAAGLWEFLGLNS